MHSCTVVSIEILPHARDLPLPAYATPGAAGMDLRAAIEEPFVLEPGKRAAIPTGLRIELPTGYEAQVRPRSGLALKHGITIVNAPGTIDSDYRGEVLVALVNLDAVPHAIERGARIAQLVVAPVTHVEWCTADHLPDTERGAGGFGSTG